MDHFQISRRGFVGAVGGTAALLASSGVPAAGPNDKVRIALVGAGSRGNQLLDTFLEQSDIDVVAVVDVDDKHAEETADKIKKKRGNEPKTSRNYHTCYDDKDVDAVVIATPDHWHALPAIEAVMAGKDVRQKSL